MNEVWASDLAPLIFVAFFGAVAVFVHPIAMGIRRRLEGKGGVDVRALTEEVTRLRDDVTQLQAGHGDAAAARLLELEERVDFAERLLARGGNEQER